MGKRGRVFAQRAATVVAGGFLVSMTFAGPALAQDTSTSPVAACTQLVSEINGVAAQITSAQSQLAALQGLPTSVPALPVPTIDTPLDPLTSSGADTSDTSTATDPLTDSVQEFSVDNKAFVTQADSVAAQIAALQTRLTGLDADRARLAGEFANLCSGLNLPGTGTTSGNVQETTFPAAEYPQSYDSSGSGSSTTTPETVYTQVASVPTGGVDTGDGSFGG